jgi:crotonobetainyl-CoA:carnitine CoA-transferase CaiB-like acyl-CoA transferase
VKLADIPIFGNLSKLTVLFQGHTIAAPFAAELLAENGAKVICLESSISPDMARVSAEPFGFWAEHRNQLGINLNLVEPEGQEVFLNLLKKIDIFFEGNKGGAMASWGLTDEVMWEANPKLVIVHISGFGQTGVREYVTRTSFDPIGQAFSGYMFLNGYPNQEPLRVNPYVCDYDTALFACWSALAAYIGAQQTGKGESVDVSQFESMLKLQYSYPTCYFQKGEIKTRMGNDDPVVIGFGCMPCKDGNHVFISCAARGPIRSMIRFLGFENDPLYSHAIQLLRRGDPASEKLDAAIKAYCLSENASDVDKKMLEIGVPCSMIHNIETIKDNPHVQAREVFTEWEDQRFGTIGGVNVIPKMKVRPGKIWGAAPDWGGDNEDILIELGYDQEQIHELYEKRIMSKTPGNGGYKATPEKMNTMRPKEKLLKKETNH